MEGQKQEQCATPSGKAKQEMEGGEINVVSKLQ